MIATILLALDASERAARVAEVGGQLARSFGATIQPFRALLIPPEFPAAGAGAEPDLLPATMFHAAETELLALVSGIVEVAVARPLVRVGEPSHTILAVSEELGVDLIVLGSHPFRGWDHVLGTTVGTVASRAGCSVYVVRETGHPRARRGGAAP